MSPTYLPMPQLVPLQRSDGTYREVVSLWNVLLKRTVRPWSFSLSCHCHETKSFAHVPTLMHCPLPQSRQEVQPSIKWNLQKMSQRKCFISWLSWVFCESSGKPTQLFLHCSVFSLFFDVHWSPSSFESQCMSLYWANSEMIYFHLQIAHCIQPPSFLAPTPEKATLLPSETRFSIPREDT